MDILIPSKNITIKIANELQEYQDVFIKLLETSTQFLNIKNVTISFFFFKESKSQIQASTWQNDEQNFTIYFNINKLSKMRFIELFLHECKHIEQYSNNRLKKVANGHLWENTFFTDEFVQDPNNYEILPWEQESFEIEFHWDKLHRHMRSSMLTKVRSLVTVDNLLTP